MARKKSIRWHWNASPAENARRVLPKLAGEYFATVRALLAQDPPPAELHRLRLASKRFRYILELFRPCYAAGLAQRIDALKHVQNLLGECNDAVVSLPRIEAVLRGRPAEAERMRQFLETRAAGKADDFRRYWREEFDAEGREQWWREYLTRYARAPLKGR
jgi:CHAD domain-containing protein